MSWDHHNAGHKLALRLYQMCILQPPELPVSNRNLSSNVPKHYNTDSQTIRPTAWLGVQDEGNGRNYSTCGTEKSLPTSFLHHCYLEERPPPRSSRDGVMSEEESIIKVISCWLNDYSNSVELICPNTVRARGNSRTDCWSRWGSTNTVCTIFVTKLWSRLRHRPVSSESRKQG